ncbi:MAG: hypothetical protein M1495_24460 [Bacteroidetes bacterium]|nr:hypothetical protein [Bacteroidota bacterium]
MKKIFFETILILVTAFASLSFAQFEGYGSITAGYNKNPLNNYQTVGDQTKQTYLELKYTNEFPKSLLNFSYVSGLMLFNEFTDRNFYEHSFSANYQLNFDKQLSNSQIKNSSADEEDSNETDSVQEENSSDEIRNTMLFGVTLNSRLDKEAHKDFDNYGLSFNFIYNHVTNPDFNFTISNSLSLRNYSNIEDLSNLTDLLSFETGKTTSSGMNYGINLSGGFKYYTQTYYDTTQFEQIRSFITKSQGKGKPGSKVGSNKKILITPQSNGTYQIAFGIYAKKEWANNSFQANVLYRYNIRSQNRYLAQYVNTSFLSEDIYNDFFSYEGPEAAVKFAQTLPIGMKLTIDGLLQYKKYTAPALDLAGEQIDGDRHDLHSYVEINLSRYFDLGNDFGFDITLTGGFLRNQSNDDYNDFSSYFAAVSVGVSF